MRFDSVGIPAVAVLLFGAAVAPQASAHQHATGTNCATPRLDQVVARGASAVVFRTHSPSSDADVTYSYCRLSTGRSSFLATPEKPEDNQVGFLSEVQITGNYLAFVETVASDETPIPNPTTTEIVNVATGKKTVVPQPAPQSGLYSPGAGQNLRLSSTGVVAATGTTYSSGIPDAQYVLAYQAATGKSRILTVAAPGALANLAIYVCSVGCLAPDAAVVGWTNSGTTQFEPASG
jgi:hypothetical protein